MVKSRSGSSDVDSSTYVPMIGCFVAGFVTNRLLNHQNVVTGELEEGLYSMKEIEEYWTKPGSGGFVHDIKKYPIIWGVLWFVSLICMYKCIYYADTPPVWLTIVEILSILMMVIAPSFLAWALNNELAWIVICVVICVVEQIIFLFLLYHGLPGSSYITNVEWIIAIFMIFMVAIGLPVLGSYSIYRWYDNYYKKNKKNMTKRDWIIDIGIVLGALFWIGLSIAVLRGYILNSVNRPISFRDLVPSAL